MQSSNSGLQSTPPRPRSNQSHTLSSPPSSRHQSELIELIGAELDDQTYEFDPDVVARMLSPKLPHEGAGYVPHPALGDFECLIDDPTVKKAMQRFPKLDYTDWDSSERKNYNPLAAFLTKCVQDCDNVYDAIHQKLPQDSCFKVAERTKRWLPQLCFIKYDKETGDGIQHSKPLRPDIVGVDNFQAATQDLDNILCWWNLSSADIKQKGKDVLSRQNYQIVIAMEVKDNWQEMVVQSGTYARGLFAASPLRSFSLVIAANHKKQDLRFLIFHRGGLSTSKALKLDQTGCGALQKMLLSVLLWQSAEDAGLPTFTNGQSFLLPKSLGMDDVWNIKNVIHHSLTIRGRNTYVISLEPTKSDAEKIMDTKSKDYRYLTRTKYPRVTSPAPRSTRTSNKLQSNSGAGKLSSKTKKSPLSNPQQPQETATDTPKRSADEATLDPISHREKRHRPLAAIEPSSIIVSKQKMALPSKLVVKCSWPNSAKEDIEPSMYAACVNAFGTPQSLGSFVACYRDNQPMCNSIFLPPNGDDVNKYHWAVFNSREKSTPIPKAVEPRMLWITVLTDEGRSLDECSDALDLCECLLHSMIGWLSAYQRGYLHRDISIGNLIKLIKPVSREPFNAFEFIKLVAFPEEREGLNKIDKLSDEIASRFINDKHPEYQELLTVARDLNIALTQYGLTTEFKAIVIDGDMAAYIPDYFDSLHDTGVFSGTVEFMSLRLLEAMENNSSLLQSPLDDLWSFFWTALWATLTNRHHPNQTDMEKNWRLQLCAGGAFREKVAALIKMNSTLEKKQGYSPILRQMAPLLRRWYTSLNEMGPRWTEELDTVEEKGNADAGALMLFHKFAYGGMLDIVRMISEHIQLLRKASDSLVH